MKASRLGLFVLCVFAACGGDDESSPGGSISAVSPEATFFGRTIELTVSGAGTQFGGDTTITFDDPAVKTLRVEALSPVSLRASVEIGADARSGPHDVVVTTPSGTLTLARGLLLSAALKYDLGGTATQGGLLDFALVNQDKENPFTTAPVLTSGAIAVRFTEVAPGRIAGTALVDPLAPLGGLRLGLAARNARGEQVGFATAADDPLAPVITDAPPVLALGGGQVNGNEAIAGPRQTNLYKASSPSDDSVFFLDMKTVGNALRTTSGTRLVGAVAPASGKFADGARIETTFNDLAGGRAAVGYVKSAGDVFFAIHTNDFSGGPSEYNYSIRAAVQKASTFSLKEPTPPDSPAKLIAEVELAGPFVALDGAIDTIDDADYVLISYEKGGRVFVNATPVEGDGPLNVAIFGGDPGTANCTAYASGGLGIGQAEAVIPPGEAYCARINSTSSMTMKYRLVVSGEL